jgi:hypothetical protein
MGTAPIHQKFQQYNGTWADFSVKQIYRTWGNAGLSMCGGTRWYSYKIVIGKSWVPLVYFVLFSVQNGES